MDDKPKKISYFDFAHALTGYTLYNKETGKQISKWEAFNPKIPLLAEVIIAGTHPTIGCQHKSHQFNKQEQR